MVKEYRVDNRKRKKLIQDRIKKHPKWKKRKWVRYGLVVTLILLLIIIPARGWFMTEQVYDGKSIDEVGIKTLLMGSEMSFSSIAFFIGMPVFLYFRSLKNSCSDNIGWITDEILILTDKEFNSGCRGSDRASIKEYYIQIIKYENIKKIVLNKYSQKLKIYGDMGLIVYSDYENDVIDHTKKHPNNTTVIDFYYENSEDFIKTLEEKSGIKVQVIDEVDESYNRAD